MKRQLLIFLLLAVHSICRADGNVKLSGHLTQLNDGVKLVLIPAALHKRMDPVASSVLSSGRFKMEVDIAEPILFYLRAEGVSGQVTILLAPGQQVMITGSFENPSVTGSATNDEFNTKFTRIRRQFNTESAAIRKKYQGVSLKLAEARKANDRKAIEQVETSAEWIEYNNASKEQSEKFNRLLKKTAMENRDSYWGPLLVMAHTAYLTAEFEEFYEIFSDKAKNSLYGKRFYEELIGVVGKAPDFRAKDSTGTVRGLNEIIAGKNYVLVDFWASWCVPCRKSIPKVKELAEKYADKNMVVVSISIDKDKDAWIRAVREERMPWLNLLDEAEISKAFGVLAIPSVFLIDPSGKVIFGKQSGDPLIQKLQEVFGK